MTAPADLSSAELRATLTQRGVGAAHAAALVARRDHPPTASHIRRLLDPREDGGE